MYVQAMCLLVAVQLGVFVALFNCYSAGKARLCEDPVHALWPRVHIGKAIDFREYPMIIA